jgi:hypothetical protein
MNSSGRMYLENLSTAITATSTTIVANQWQHIALTRNSNTIRMFVNGVLDATTATRSGTYYSSGAMRIGASGINENFTGYISNMRILNGTALYTSPFTPPTGALTAITNTSLLTCQSNKFVDNSSTASVITPVITPQVWRFSPFNLGDLGYNTDYVKSTYGGSAYFNGTGDYLSLASNTAFDFGATNFTVEGWFYFTALPIGGSNDNLFNFGSFNPYLYIWGSDSTFTLRSTQTGGDIIVVPHGISLYQWYHIAVVKTGTNFVLYKNGLAIGSGTSTGIVSESKALEIGGASTFGHTGYVSSFRTVKGTSVYTANFTPLNAPLAITQSAGTNISAITSSATTLLLNFTNTKLFFLFLILFTFLNIILIILLYLK